MGISSSNNCGAVREINVELSSWKAHYSIEEYSRLCQRGATEWLLKILSSRFTSLFIVLCQDTTIPLHSLNFIFLARPLFVAPARKRRVKRILMGIGGYLAIVDSIFHGDGVSLCAATSIDSPLVSTAGGFLAVWHWRTIIPNAAPIFS